MIYEACMSRKPWELPFLADPREIAGVRNVIRTHLRLWGLCEVVEAAQLCASELIANVTTHVGVGTPTTLAVSMSGTYLRIEVHDPDTRALPTLCQVDAEAETGRGMALVNAVAERWGVQLLTDRKVTWCEIATDLIAPDGHGGGARVTRAEALLTLYGAARTPRPSAPSLVSVALAEEAAIHVIADLLHWLRAHGRDPDETLDRAQMHFEAEVSA
ncbi:ATP-binding protein [Streptomyces sp. WAC05374]|uniref:ATP-binding protein n=1 Tax=Streptomyces sp. WAC05374 TaxID=2487420 RepID=UPI000F88C890|nr:ATP-binding protein [Streptomyces sp. WAC05374]RST07614.1 ATP-binding protein [Streptomyces sp. WAC05374]TDF44326.1 ATP-binding protein [Streptomyces sp. WAC05374]TDF53744.1 ATP-binding protein [Streptomyces sp. WAC05374]TDF58577.1 ATP-binding protein [Streptomyces sp. WAC05374]